MLRGVNLAGSSKVPYPNGATYIRDGFFDHRAVSFVGRPFPLDEADEHFRRLKRWGLTCLRFLITWEAVEHAGPGIYDLEYLDYLEAVVRKAGEHGLSLFIDPHEDVWSRFTGGDGAPGWTLEAVGLDMTHFQETGAAIVHATHGDPFPRMIWPTNAHKLAAATMFNLFFAGNDLAPATLIDGEPAQELLQRHYIAAIQAVAHWLRKAPNVIGYDTLNEPMRGWIGLDDLIQCCGRPKLGASPSPYQAMLLGDGIPQEVEVWGLDLRGNRPVGSVRLNPGGERAWRDGVECIWRQNGVWDLDSRGQPRLLRPLHFAEVNGRKIDFNEDYYKPFANRFARAIRSEVPDVPIFLETEPGHSPPRWTASDAPNVVYAPHWYDVFVLVLKDYSPFLAADFRKGSLLFGSGNIRRNFAEQMLRFRSEAREFLPGAPVLIGELGIAYDMGRKKAFRSGDFTAQTRAMDRSLSAIEDALLNCTLWNYTPDNSNARGDLWNDEDLSIFSRDQQTDPNDLDSGGRALQAVVRPYPIATAGQPLRMRFDLARRRFEFTFRHDPSIAAPTEIFLPALHFSPASRFEAPHGLLEHLPEEQRLRYTPTRPGGEHTIRVTGVKTNRP